MNEKEISGIGSSASLRMTVYASLMAALVAAGAYLAIPIGPVPIVLQNLLGLPVFAGGVGGIGRFAGPTGGYLLGFLPAVYVIGFISNASKTNVVRDLLAMICGSLIIYACGVWWLNKLTGMTLGKALAVGMYPFLPGDALKMAVAIPIAKALRPVIKKE